MDEITYKVTDLKTNPAKVLRDADSSPVAITTRGKVKSYVISKDVFDKLVEHLENLEDDYYIRTTDFSKGIPAEELYKQLGI